MYGKAISSYYLLKHLHTKSWLQHVSNILLHFSQLSNNLAIYEVKNCWYKFHWKFDVSLLYAETEKIENLPLLKAFTCIVVMTHDSSYCLSKYLWLIFLPIKVLTFKVMVHDSLTSHDILLPFLQFSLNLTPQYIWLLSRQSTYIQSQ